MPASSRPREAHVEAGPDVSAQLSLHWCPCSWSAGILVSASMRPTAQTVTTRTAQTTALQQAESDQYTQSLKEREGLRQLRSKACAGVRQPSGQVIERAQCGHMWMRCGPKLPQKSHLAACFSPIYVSAIELLCAVRADVASTSAGGRPDRSSHLKNCQFCCAEQG